MKFFIIFFFIFNFANAENYIYNYEIKKFISNKKNISESKKKTKNILKGSYNVYLLGKKNNLNDAFNEITWIDDKNDLLRKSNRLEYYSNFNKKFLDEDKFKPEFNLNLKNFIFKKKNNLSSTNIKILNNKEYVKKDFNYQLFKSLKLINKINNIKKYANLDKWQYETSKNRRNIAVFQRLLGTEINFLPIFAIENYPINQIYEINFRVQIKYKKNLILSNSENIKIITNKNDWFLSGDEKIYISFKNIFNKYFKITEDKIDKIKIDEIYLHLNDESLKKEIYPNFKFSYFDLNEIFLDEKILVFSQDFLKNKNYVEIINRYKNTYAGNIQVKIKDKYKKIHINQDKIFNNSIKIYIGEYKNLDIRNLDISNYNFLYQNFSEVFFFFKDKNNLEKADINSQNEKIKIEKNKNKNFYSKAFFAIMKTFYPILIFLILISYPLLIYNFYNKKDYKNILVYFAISSIFLFSFFEINVINFNSFLWIFLYNFITISILQFKNPLVLLLKGNCICILLIFFTYMFKLKIISAFISYFCLILIILTISRMLIKIKSNAKSPY